MQCYCKLSSEQNFLLAVYLLDQSSVILLRFLPDGTHMFVSFRHFSQIPFAKNRISSILKPPFIESGSSILVWQVVCLHILQ